MKIIPKILLIGHAQHGKSTTCELLRDHFGFQYTIASMVAIDKVIWPAIGQYYDSKEQCYADRVNHRALWFELIRFYCRNDNFRLARHVLAVSDIYEGVRSLEEFYAIKDSGLIDTIVWVDRSKLQPLEPKSSMELTADLAEVFLDNNQDDHTHLYHQIISQLNLVPMGTSIVQ